MLYEIKHRHTGAVLFSFECGSLKLCIEAAVSARASLARAYLAGAYLTGADLIDAGQDRRGFRFWAWRNKEGVTAYRAGCHEWTDFAEALAWYGDAYKSNGDRFGCIARLMLLRDEAQRRWPAEVKQEAA